MVVLYSIGCSQCDVLENKLRSANIGYVLNENIEEMKNKGYLVLPVLEVDGRPLKFTDAIKWVNEREAL